MMWIANLVDAPLDLLYVVGRHDPRAAIFDDLTPSICIAHPDGR